MKTSIRYPPWTTILSGVMLGIFLSIMAVPAALAADVCDKKPDLPQCSDGGDDGEIALTLTYVFGDCNKHDCATSVVTATGTKKCDQRGNCNFTGNIPEKSVPFYLPEDLMVLLGGTEWKDTLLSPDNCFGVVDPASDVPNADAGGRGVELAWHEDGTWFAAIGSIAKDIAGEIDRQYVFYFLCDNAACGDSFWTPFSMAGVYDGAELLRVEADAKDRGGKSIPCRCTISSEPNCPGDIDVPMTISVVEEQL